jgi:hypothetical protein
MNKTDRFSTPLFIPLRRVTGLLWFKSGFRKQYSYQDMFNLKKHRSSMLMLSTYARFISITGTVYSPGRSAQAQNPIDQLDEQHRISIPAVSSLGGSPTPAR